VQANLARGVAPNTVVAMLYRRFYIVRQSISTNYNRYESFY